MTETKKINNKYIFKDLGLGHNVEIKLSGFNPAKTGEGQYGTWYLWFGSVINTGVRDSNNNIVENYTGDIVFFPTEKLNEQLVSLANGNNNVKVRITKEAIETNGRMYKKYTAEKLSNGDVGKSSLTTNEMNLINDANELKNEGHNVTEEILIKASQEPQYGGQINEERAKELFKLM